MKKINKSVKIASLIFLFVIGAFITRALINHSKAELLENDTEVERNTNLTYYLNVYYDGIDVDGVNSEDGVTAEVKSGHMYITDKIPEGLEFQGFVESEDGSIGAVKRSDDTMCLGKVIDDTGDTTGWNNDNTEFVYHGLHYTKSNNTVSFTVKNLKAGCYLTVGIITKTPSTIDDPNTDEVEKRRDFYNFASAKENALTINSNTVHVFMGKEDLQRYDVHYEYTGDVPNGAPAVPNILSYVEGAKVNVAANPDVTGYTFSGWTTNDAEVNNGTFLMPASTVTLRGSFTELPKYKVKYVVNGTKPKDYVVPDEKSYYADETVEGDVLKEGDIINGYRFLGWNTSNVQVDDDNEFVMPSNAVTFTGQFEEVKHSVTYRFYDGVLPPNADSLLPETKEYSMGTTVNLEDPGDADGYEFLGWYYDDSFTIEDEDIVIYGEWKRKSGEFKPEIKKTISDKKEIYNPGDTITFEIEVKNNNDFDIKDIVVEEKNEDAIYKSGEDYEINTDHIATIPLVKAGKSVKLYSEITVTEEMIGKHENTASIIGGTTDNYYELSQDEMKANVSYTVEAKKQEEDKPNTIPEIIDKMTIRVPITGKKINVFVLLFILIGISSAAAGLYLFKRNKK